MEKLEIALNFVKNIVWALILQGVVAVIIGVLIIIWPDLLSWLVGIGLIVMGVVVFIMAAKINKFSKLKFDL